MYVAEGVTVTVGGRKLIDGIDLSVPPGRLVAIIGPNGAGKSTLLRALAGERKISAGRIGLHGRDVAAMTPAALAAWRAVLAQSVSMAFAYPVAEVVALGVSPRATRREVEAEVARALATVALADTLHRPITELSGGEQQRVHLARVLVQLRAAPHDGKERYLLLDEPTTHLDPAHQVMVARLARAHVASGGGVLAVLHDLDLAAAIADEVVLMEGGRIVAAGSPRAVLVPDLLEDIYGVRFEAITAGDRLWIRSIHREAGASH